MISMIKLYLRNKNISTIYLLQKEHFNSKFELMIQKIKPTLSV